MKLSQSKYFCKCIFRTFALKHVILALILATTISLLSCSRETTEGNEFVSEIALDDVLAISNTRRYNVMRPDPASPEVLEIAAKLRHRIPRWVRPEEGLESEYISHVAAIADIEHLFSILWGLYIAYEYFGGDEAFLPIKDDILQQLDLFDVIHPIELGQIISDSLAYVITDRHFSLYWYDDDTYGWWFPTSPVSFVENSRAVFDRVETGYRNRNNNLYVINIVGHDLCEVFRLSIDENGHFFYSPILMLELVVDYYKIIIEYEDGSSEPIFLKENRLPFHIHDDVTGMWNEEGTPIVYLARMPYDGEPDARRFLSYGEMLNKEPISILDLRNNPGGHPTLPARWLQRLVDEIVPSNAIKLSHNNISTVTREAFRTSVTPGWMVERDKILIVLVDRYSASASEAFVDHVLNLQNTLIIGQNTSGTLLTGNIATSQLPNSGIFIRVPRVMYILPDNVFEEAVGFAPDIWVHGDVDPLVAAIAMLRNAGLTKD